MSRHHSHQISLNWFSIFIPHIVRTTSISKTHWIHVNIYKYETEIYKSINTTSNKQLTKRSARYTIYPVQCVCGTHIIASSIRQMHDAGFHSASHGSILYINVSIASGVLFEKPMSRRFGKPGFGLFARSSYTFVTNKMCLGEFLVRASWNSK